MIEKEKEQKECWMKEEIKEIKAQPEEKHMLITVDVICISCCVINKSESCTLDI